jgi:hypothetical protein
VSTQTNELPQRFRQRLGHTQRIRNSSGLGLTSATMLVMGSMIGSGIFIVSAEIAAGELARAPDWRLAHPGFMNVGALYGEYAMMPRAGGQYVYLQEALQADLGFHGWMSGDSDRTMRHGCGLASFSRFVPSRLQTGLFISEGATHSHQPDDARNMDVGRTRRTWSPSCWWSFCRWSISSA